MGKRFSIKSLQNFVVQKNLPLVFALSINTTPALAWGEGGCSFSKKHKASTEATTEQVENLNYSKK